MHISFLLFRCPFGNLVPEVFFHCEERSREQREEREGREEGKEKRERERGEKGERKEREAVRENLW